MGGLTEPGKMRGRKKGCSLPSAFVLLFCCVTGRATAESDGSEEERVVGAALPPLILGHSVCAMKADDGPCKAIHVRYFFNIQSQLSRKAVVAQMKKANLLPVVTVEEHPNTVNSSSPAEEPDEFHGILVNLLPTAPNEESNTLNSSSQKEEHNQFPIFFEPPPIPSLCMTPMDRGLCRAKELRFFYNHLSGRCHPFSYSGCGGNENNFTSRKSCLRICKKGFNKKKGGRKLIKIKKKRRKQSVKALGEEIIPERIQL
ncbi:tissue factor pathway inhibitor (lipoprotein-associated coagulation inhibitor), transcript variant X2 [Pitangus sulphuratus]|nr:tissue factor pathway inhibitor (lipoprotein-associated coagulation inhibitor), transcript variant X2 [Pitangus sulphuratus]